ncbi:Cyclin-dependent kinase 5 activator 2 [Bagarius yarrelli]|uniref:Cyclin-dependent kinase 5 activator 2 n=1 Tax=Bagarius yarrelli TaxID=175774 RepID=A0A556V1G9_BAGYA|nr:Cyclin-dependent kinase 5 activator 2 [Bagarius yarrelli]
MGTTTSVSSLQQDELHGNKKTILIKPRLIVTAFGFKLVKQKSGRNVNRRPLPSQTTNIREELKAPSQNCPPQLGEIETLKETNQVEDLEKNHSNSKVLKSPVRIVVQASTGELLLCLGRFLRRRCFKISSLTSNEVIAWVRNVDRTLLLQGWQEEVFISPSILVFVYLLCRDTVSDDITSPTELHGVVLTCLYLTYSYLGTEISYPLQPFVIDADKDVFWTRALGVINKLSSEMLRINTEPQFFTEVLQELKNEEEQKKNDLDR